MNKLQNFMKTVGTEQKENVVKKSIKSILKWPGGKMKVLQHLKPHFSTSGTFYDVFGGSGVISFNSDAEKIIYNDLNFDCKNLFTHINDPKFIDKLKTLFAKNNKDKYLKYRKLFNTKTSSDFDRACLFYYLNKCGFNGLVRYNKAGGWNVPPGDNLEKRTFDKDDITILKDVIRKKNIEFLCLGFEDVLKLASTGDVVYMDPPYLPSNEFKTMYTNYQKDGFCFEQHKQIVALAESLQARGIKVIISNSSTNQTKQLYSNASKIIEIVVARSISPKKEGRKQVKELIAIYERKEEI